MKKYPHSNFLILVFASLFAVFSLCLPANAQDFSSAYDLRSVTESNTTVSWVPSIQNQGYFGDCWTFASATAMDSDLLQNGMLGAPVSTPPTIAISSWALSTGNGAPESLVGPNYGGDGNHTWGGFEYQALGYVTRGEGDWEVPGVNPSNTNIITTMGGGPVLDSSPVTPSNAFPSVFDNSTPSYIGNLIPPVSQTPAFQALGVTLFDQGFSSNVPLPTATTNGGYVFNLGAADPQVEVIKSALQSYGAVTTSMNATDYSYFVPVSNGNGTYTENYFNPSTQPNNTDHEVSIIGWNDNYTMTNPNTGVVSTGAWLVQNSWGTNAWGNQTVTNNGTFWASYNDAAIGRTGVAAFQMGSTAGLSPTVLQNELGPLAYANNFIDAQGPLGMAQLQSTNVASILTPTQNGILSALGIATQVGNISLTISIYSGWLNGPLGTLLLQQSVMLGGIGYEQIALNSDITLLANDPIAVELQYGAENAAPIVIGDDGLYGTNYLTVPTGLSYYNNGTNWVDLSTEVYQAYSGYGSNADGGVLYLKGIMSVPEPSTYALLGLSALALAVAARRRA